MKVKNVFNLQRFHKEIQIYNLTKESIVRIQDRDCKKLKCVLLKLLEVMLTLTKTGSSVPGDILSILSSVPGDILSVISSLPGDILYVLSSVPEDILSVLSSVPGVTLSILSSVPGDILLY